MSLAEAMERSGWPISDLVRGDPNRNPTVAKNVDDFLEKMAYGNHMDDIVVLRGGLDALGQKNAMPAEVLRSARGSGTVGEFLRNVDPPMLKDLRGRIYYQCTSENIEKASKFSCEVVHDVDGNELRTMKELAEELSAREKEGGKPKRGVYLTELRYKKKRTLEVVDGYRETAKTLLERDVKDFVQPPMRDVFLYWDRYDEGVFVGQRGAGSSLHVDQCQWSNIGKNWFGWKLLAIWKYGDSDSFYTLDNHLDEVFFPPLKKSQRRALEKAHKIALIGPGDVYIFSGACAHTSIIVSDELSLSAYESFCNCNCRHASVLMETATTKHFDECWMNDREWTNMKREIADHVVHVQKDFEHGVVAMPRKKKRRTSNACFGEEKGDDPLFASIVPSRPGDDKSRMRARVAFESVVSLLSKTPAFVKAFEDARCEGGVEETTAENEG
eukprot:g4502.t1